MIRLIAAVDRKRGISKQGVQPWSIPDDAKYFSRLTKSNGGAVLIGSITYSMLKGPLGDRHNFVLSHDKEDIPGVTLVDNLEKFLGEYSNKDLWVIGGANVFDQVMALGKADELYLTKIDADFGCNQFFPEYEQTFRLLEQSPLHEQNGFIYTYHKLVKLQ